MPCYEMNVTVMGTMAGELLAEDREASVMGLTSRGLFVHLPPRWVLYLTPEAYPGPLTLNLPDYPGAFMGLNNGVPGKITSGCISFPKPGLVINTQRASSWWAPPLLEGHLASDQRMAQLVQVAGQALARRHTSIVSTLLPTVLGIVDRLEAQGNAIFPLLENLARTLKESNIAAIAEDIQPFIGLGTGLTPSGDDLVAGFLLALARWGHVIAPHVDLTSLSHILLPLVYLKTTTLSANLIECAFQGQADGRLLFALDGIMSGCPDAATCANYLADWGNTSGLDALTGMTLALVESV